MKTCSKCGFRNMTNSQATIKDVKCENCNYLLFDDNDSKKFNAVTNGNSETKRKLLHDEEPWEFTQ